jgi:hypothetical protein
VLSGCAGLGGPARLIDCSRYAGRVVDLGLFIEVASVAMISHLMPAAVVDCV